jgi:dephospho-CoA kinase
LDKVEALVFPALKEDLEKWMNEHPAKVHILESATILEKEYFKGFGDFALVVTAPYQVRIRRAMERDSSSEEQVRARIQKQKMMNSLQKTYWLLLMKKQTELQWVKMPVSITKQISKRICLWISLKAIW